MSNFYTKEQREFLINYIPGHHYNEIVNEFNKCFPERQINVSKVKSFCGNNKISTGFNGRFKKGQEPPNKGEKGLHIPGSEKGWFKKGNIPVNHKEVGSESIRKDKSGQSYIYVKVKEPRTWRMKHIIEWEKYNGQVPKGKIIIFLDGNTMNTDISNLAMIDRKIHVRLNQDGMRYNNRELTKTAVSFQKLKEETRKKRKKVASE